MLAGCLLMGIIKIGLMLTFTDRTQHLITPKWPIFARKRNMSLSFPSCDLNPFTAEINGVQSLQPQSLLAQYLWEYRGEQRGFLRTNSGPH
ncbi:Uncharacterised protein [Yersinia frederiksenii]|jgi:hypothetical protein|nr:Uncharacterised protein [Yersinia frederiksenii]